MSTPKHTTNCPGAGAEADRLGLEPLAGVDPMVWLGGKRLFAKLRHRHHHYLSIEQ
jgi:hypothetical protein